MMPFTKAFETYALALRKTATSEKTEFTDRAALQALLQAASDEINAGFGIQHEPKRVQEKGAPDFKVVGKGLIRGYIETKQIGEQLDKVLKSDQIARYKKLSQNIILTDYLHFIWISKDGIQRESLCHETDLDSKKFRLREDRIEAVAKLLQGFFSTAPEGIGNTLEPIEPQPNLLLPAIAAEAEAAQEVKDKPILVITGNPPYSGHSKNKGAWISAAIDGYKFTIELDENGREYNKPLGEKNPKWLNDDYVKFIRFAQMKMDAVEEGVVGVITNHSWLDNPTFRGMRQSLMRSFERIYVLDLHGNAKKKETAPDGSKDENVFDIEQGVAISLLVKKKDVERGVWRGDLWGKRLEKYRASADSNLKRVNWQTLNPRTSFYLFAPQDEALGKEYTEGVRMPEMFPINVLGFQTHRDGFAVSFNEAEMKQKLREFADPTLPDVDLARRYGLKGNDTWSLSDARSAARGGAATPPQRVAYRPFDDRWSEFSGLTIDRPRRELLDHVAGRETISILVPRGIGVRDWQHSFVARFPANDCVISDRSREANQVFPLWRFDERSRVENFSPAFRAFLDSRYDDHYTPEEILGLIYAVLHAPSYRTRYAEFLRIDFPRIPFPEHVDDFETLSKLGWALIEAHLLRTLPRAGLAKYHGKGDHSVESVKYAEADQAVFINNDQSFRPVPENVWNFHIGGYRVIDKYLKSRKGRTLTLDEIDHVSAIADSLAFTIDQMAKIDVAYKKAFPGRG